MNRNYEEIDTDRWSGEVKKFRANAKIIVASSSIWASKEGVEQGGILNAKKL